MISTLGIEGRVETTAISPCVLSLFQQRIRNSEGEKVSKILISYQKIFWEFNIWNLMVWSFRCISSFAKFVKLNIQNFMCLGRLRPLSRVNWHFSAFVKRLLETEKSWNAVNRARTLSHKFFHKLWVGKFKCTRFRFFFTQVFRRKL